MFFVNCLCTGIYQLIADGHVIRPRRYQAPPQKVQPILAVAILPDNRYLLAGSDIIPGWEYRYLDEPEYLCKLFWRVLESKTSAHGCCIIPISFGWWSFKKKAASKD